MIGAVQWVVGPSGWGGVAARAAAAAFLGWWALDEMVRGVNPWRRVLGTVVLVGLVASLIRSRGFQGIE